VEAKPEGKRCKLPFTSRVGHIVEILYWSILIPEMSASHKCRPKFQFKRDGAAGFSLHKASKLNW
jgi:hypothetical protein